MQIVFLDTRTVGDIPNLKRLEELGEVIFYPDTQPHQVCERVQTADVVITNKVKITRETMAACPQLRLICVAATGTNNVDLAAANAQNIAVKNVKGYSTDSVAQLTFTLLLAILNSPAYYDAYVKSGEYAQETIFTHLGRPFWELRGKRFGIVGLGEIGRQVAKIADAFGAEVVYFSASGVSQDLPYARLELADLLKTCDVISIHAPLNDQTTGLIGYAQLCQMKASVILLNTSRGGIVVEADLARALDENRLAGAGMDVFTQEPIPLLHPYLNLKQPDKLILTPHVGWSSIEARIRLMDGVWNNIRQFVEN